MKKKTVKNIKNCLDEFPDDAPICVEMEKSLSSKGQAYRLTIKSVFIKNGEVIIRTRD